MKTQIRPPACRYRALAAALLVSLAFWSCSRAYEETISGVVVPVPKAMAKTAEKPAEMSLFGFAAGQATYEGDMPVDKIVEFYKTELPARGWQPNVNLQGGGAMLAYSREGKSLLINAAKENDKTVLSLAIAGVGK